MPPQLHAVLQPRPRRYVCPAVVLLLLYIALLAAYYYSSVPIPLAGAAAAFPSTQQSLLPPPSAVPAAVVDVAVDPSSSSAPAAPAPSAEAALLAVLNKATQSNPAALSRLVLVVEANAGFLDFAKNFLHFAQRTKPPVGNLVFASLDARTHDQLTAMGALSFAVAEASLSSRAEEFRTPAYNSIVLHKFRLAQQVIALGFDCLVVDADVVLLRNPANFFLDMPVCDAAFSCEGVDSTRLLTRSPARYGNLYDHRNNSTPWFVNTGLMLWRSTPPSKRALELFLKSKYRLRNADDQLEFNRYLALRARDSPGRGLDQGFLERGRSCVSFAGLNVTVLPPVLFSTKPMAFVARLADLAAVTPCVFSSLRARPRAGRTS
jgi:hypothetical protein